ncbi:hypothetical protein [Bifidobacterium breve]|uniref:hypothetical protein n=1 Tax=Bifidobacterium breve TaxID=1685 RepID=UPI0012FF499E|nr:hypothetical protein [Bifidobacterium breve]
MEKNISCPPAEWERIVGHYSNPNKPGTPAYRLARFIQDDARASELVRQWIEDEAIKALNKGHDVAPELLTDICKRVSLEALTHRALGVSVKLIRAGVLYEKAKARYQASVDPHPSREDEERIWDGAIDRENARQQRLVDAGRIRNRTWLPYHDSTNSRPGANRAPVSSGGLDEWRLMFEPHKPVRFAPFDDMDEDHDRALADRTPVERFEVTADWCSEHGITLETIAAMSESELLAMGVDPQSVRDIASGHGLDGEAGRLDLVLHDTALSVELAERNPKSSATAILVRAGLSRRLADFALAFEKRMRDEGVSSPARMAREWEASRSRAMPDYHGYLRRVAGIVEAESARVLEHA